MISDALVLCGVVSKRFNEALILQLLLGSPLFFQLLLLAEL